MVWAPSDLVYFPRLQLGPKKVCLGRGAAIRSRRLIVTPGRFFGIRLPRRFSFQCFSPASHKAKACRAEVFPELLGPTSTTGLPNSKLTSSKRLKFLMVTFVSIDAGLSFQIGERC